jgi:hypothetical protein
VLGDDLLLGLGGVEEGAWLGPPKYQHHPCPEQEELLEFELVQEAQFGVPVGGGSGLDELLCT